MSVKVGDKVKILSEDIFAPTLYRRNRTGIVTSVDYEMVTVRPHWILRTIKLPIVEVEVIG